MEEWNDYSSDLSSHYLLTEHSQAWKVSPTKSGKLKGGDLTTESEYVRKHLGVVLANCLTEVIEKRPLDPIEYIAEWLYNYVDNRRRLIKVKSELYHGYMMAFTYFKGDAHILLLVKQSLQ